MWGTILGLFAAGPIALAPWSSLADRSGDRITEATALFSFGVFPHFAVSYVGLVLAFTALAMALRGRRPSRVAGVSALAGIVLGLGHGFLLLAFAGVLVYFAAAFAMIGCSSLS